MSERAHARQEPFSSIAQRQGFVGFAIRFVLLQAIPVDQSCVHVCMCVCVSSLAIGLQDIPIYKSRGTLSSINVLCTPHSIFSFTGERRGKGEGRREGGREGERASAREKYRARDIQRAARERRGVRHRETQSQVDGQEEAGRATET